ncbi:MAG TPA: hypothetical protein VKB67_01970 [Rhizomicrobium sp.]|nr:hypothetical protein [Rhizomicrobium sp.]
MSADQDQAGSEQTFDERTAGYDFNPNANDPHNDIFARIGAPPPSLQKAPQTNPQTAFGDLDYLKKEMDKSNERGERLLREQREFVTGKLAGIEKDASDIENTPVPTLEKQPPSPQSNLSQGMMEYMQAATVLAALGGAFARGNATVALNAFAGAVKGFTEGKRQDFDAKVEEWKEASARVKDDNQAKLDAYNAIMKKKEWSMDMKMNMIKVVAQQYQDEMAFNTAESGRYMQFAALLSRSEQAQENYELKQGALANQTDRTRAYIKYTDQLGGRQSLGNRLFNAKISSYAQQHGGQLPSEDEQEKMVVEVQATMREGAAIGQRSGAVAIQATEANRILPRVQQLSDASPRRGIAVWNEAQNKWRVQSGDPQFAEFVAQLNALISVYGQVLARGGQGTVEQREHARETLNPNQPTAAFNAALRAVKYDIDVARASPNAALKEIGNPPEMPPVGDQPTSPSEAPKPHFKYDENMNLVQ